MTQLANADLLPVPPERRTWNWWHIASLWIGMAICIPTYTLASGLMASGWFGIQTWIGGWAIYKLIEVIWPGIGTLPQLLPAFVGLNTGEFVCFMLFWAMNVWIVLRGMDSIKFLETWGSPFLLAVGAALFIWAAVRAGGLGPMLQNPSGSAVGRPPVGSIFGAGLTSAVAFWGTMALSIPDFSRDR